MPSQAKGLVDVTSYLSQLAAGLDKKVLAAAVRKGAEVIAEEARAECRSAEVRETIGVVGRSEPGIAIAKVQCAGDGAYIAPWLEHGTDPHLIKVSEADRGMRSVSSINRAARNGSLEINGRFVGPVVHHPGARPYPFMRPAVDRKLDDAVSAMSAEIARRSTPAGLAEAAPPRDAEK